MKQLLTALLIAVVSVSAYSSSLQDRINAQGSYDWTELDRSWSPNSLGQFIRLCNRLYRMYPNGLPSKSEFLNIDVNNLRSQDFLVVESAQFRYVKYMLRKNNPTLPEPEFIVIMTKREVARAYEKMVTDCQRFM
jgi:hypothetical protein